MFQIALALVILLGDFYKSSFDEAEDDCTSWSPGLRKCQGYMVFTVFGITLLHQ